MATRSKDPTKAAPKARPQHSSPATSNIPQAIPATSEAVRETLEAMKIRAQRMADVDARIERMAREGVTLKGKRLEQAQRIVSDCAQAAIATKTLVVSAVCGDRDEANAILTAMENQAMWITRRLDTLSVLLGDPGTGCFLDELEPLTEERAAELDREEANNA